MQEFKRLNPGILKFSKKVLFLRGIYVFFVLQYKAFNHNGGFNNNIKLNHDNIVFFYQVNAKGWLKTVVCFLGIIASLQLLLLQFRLERKAYFLF